MNRRKHSSAVSMRPTPEETAKADAEWRHYWRLSEAINRAITKSDPATSLAPYVRYLADNPDPQCHTLAEDLRAALADPDVTAALRIVQRDVQTKARFVSEIFAIRCGSKVTP